MLPKHVLEPTSDKMGISKVYFRPEIGKVNYCANLNLCLPEEAKSVLVSLHFVLISIIWLKSLHYIFFSEKPVLPAVLILITHFISLFGRTFFERKV